MAKNKKKATKNTKKINVEKTKIDSKNNMFDILEDDKKGTNKSSRVTYIDTAKCIEIMFVLLGHIIIFYRQMGNSHPMLLSFIYTFHIPAFFIFSGILFNKKKWMNVSTLDFIISRVKALLIPYLFFEITGGIFNMIFSGKISINKLLVILNKTFSIHPNAGPDWFLLALFIANIIFYFFIKYYKEWFKYIVFIPILLIGFKFPPTNNILLLLFRGIIGFTFVYIGYALKNYFLDDYNKRYDILIVAFVLLIALMNFNGQIDIWSCWINNPILMLTSGTVGTFFLIGISKHFDNKFFQFIGKNTITFMATHEILIVPFYKLFKLPNGDKSLIFLFLTILAAEIPIMYIYNKFFPKLIGKK